MTVEFLVAYYGNPEYFRIAVRSVLEQTDDDWRLTIIEDRQDSNFDTRSWLADIGDGRVSYRANAVRRGVCGNFQALLEAATCSHVVFLGCDDVLLPDYVDTLHHLVEQFPSVAVFQPGVEVIDGFGTPYRPLGDRVKTLLRPRVHHTRVLGGEPLVTSLLHGNWVYFPSLCWRREALTCYGFRQDLPTTLDLALLIQLLQHGGELVLARRSVFQYRRHAQSASSAAAYDLTRFAEESRLLDELASSLQSQGWTRAARAAHLRLTSRAHHLLARVAGELAS